MWKFVAIAMTLSAVVALGDEAYQPTVAPTPKEDAIVRWAVTRLCLSGGPGQRPLVDVGLTAVRADGECARDASGCMSKTVTYTDQVAATMLTQLNVANLTNNSLYKRVMTRLVTDGHLPAAGIVVGTPGVTYVTPTPIPTPMPTETP